MAHSSDTMVGRDVELAQLTLALGVEQQTGGQPPRPGVVLLAGDAGVGKTRLLVELRDHAQASGWLVLAGHCLDFGDSALPYLPFSEVLGRLDRELPDVVEQVVEQRPTLTRLRPGRRTLSAHDAVDDDTAALDRAELLDAVHGLLEAVAEKTPVLLVVEDVHWADRSTRDLLGYLFARSFEGPVSIVVSYRSDDLHRRHPLRPQVAQWARVPGVQRLTLDPLPETEVRRLVTELVAAGAEPLAAPQVAEVVRRSEGNAFFVEELVACPPDEEWVPDNLADLLLVRLDGLDEPARRVVRTAAVAGREVGHDLLAAASELPAADFERGVRQAVETNVLVARPGRYAFRHALLGEAVYDDLLPGERVRLHGRYCDALGEREQLGTAAELARHARRAERLDTAADAMVRAGREATTVGGPEEAAEHFEHALGLLADPGRRERLGISVSKVAVWAADALSASGHTERAAALLAEQLDQTPADVDPTARARLLSSYALLLSILETEHDPVAVTREAVALAPEGDSPVRASVLAAHAQVLAREGDPEESERAGLEALKLAERLDRPMLVSEVVTTLSGLRRQEGRDAVLRSLADAVERAQRNGALEAEVRGRFLLGRAHQDAAAWADAARWFESAMTRGEAAGRRWAPYCLEARWQLAWVRFVQGHWGDVLDLTAPSGAAPEIPQGLLTAVGLAVPVLRGEDADAELAALRGLWEREGGVAIHSAHLQLVVAGRRHDPAAAFAVYDDVVGVLGRMWHPRFAARVRLAAQTIEAVASSLATVSGGEREALARRVDELHADGASAVGGSRSDGWGPEGQAWYKRLDAETLRARWLAGIAPPPQPVLLEAWGEAEQLFDALGHVYETARVRTTLAGIHRTLGHSGEARRLGDLARPVAHRLGARPLLDELVESGSVPARGRAASASLTPRESEILALVAEGRSNGEIGKQLYIATKTVSVHVSNILGKLGASGRTEAVAVARRRGLLD